MRQEAIMTRSFLERYFHYLFLSIVLANAKVVIFVASCDLKATDSNLSFPTILFVQC